MSVHVAGRTVSTDPRVVLRAVRREVAATPRPLKLWFALLAVLCLVGAIGAIIALPAGWEVLGTTPTFEWGVLITGYVFFAITTSGLCLASSLGTVFGIEMFIPLEKRHAILALLSLVTAFGLIALDLHYPVRMVLGAVLSPSPFSPMWWMGVFYGVYLVFLITEVWSMFTGHWQIHRIACVLSSITAVLAPTTLGAVFGVLAARPYWHGAFTPPAMVTTALLSGIALLGIVFYLVHRFRLAGWERATTLAIPAIRLLMTITLAVTVLVVAWQMMFGLYGVVPGLSDATRGDPRRPAGAGVLGRPRPPGPRGAPGPRAPAANQDAGRPLRGVEPRLHRALRRPDDLRQRRPDRPRDGGGGRGVVALGNLRADAGRDRHHGRRVRVLRPRLHPG